MPAAVLPTRRGLVVEHVGPRTWPVQRTPKRHASVSSRKTAKPAGASATKQSLARELAVVNDARGAYSGHLSVHPRQRYAVSWETRLYIDSHLRQR